MSQTIKLKLKNKDGWQSIELPPPYKCTTALFRTWIDTPCIIEFADIPRKYYAYGNEDVAHYCPGDQVRMDMEAFCQFWNMKTLEFKIETFGKVEYAEEREAIMAAEGESVSTIAAVIASRPDLYAVAEQAEIWPDDF